MIKIANIVTPSPEQWERIIMGMRNPHESYDRYDSYTSHIELDDTGYTVDTNFFVGENDLKLMKQLAHAGKDHRKYMRMITVYMDITAPLYWWKEFDTYKVGTVANSCSTMHKIGEKEFTLEDFSCEHLISDFGDKDSHAKWTTDKEVDVIEMFATPTDILDLTILALNANRTAYQKAKKLLDQELPEEKRREYESRMKKYWWQMVQLLPSSYNQKRTVMLNYEVLANMYHARKGHKLTEWRTFCEMIEDLPYSELITGPMFTTKHFNISTENKAED